jgi:hypothetical protein
MSGDVVLAGEPKLVCVCLCVCFFFKFNCWAHADYEHSHPGQVCDMLPVASWSTFCLMDSLIPNGWKIVNSKQTLNYKFVK